MDPEHKFCKPRRIPKALKVLLVFVVALAAGISLHLIVTYLIPQKTGNRIHSAKKLKVLHPVTSGEKWQNSRLLNDTKFAYICNNASICKQDPVSDPAQEENLLLILVLSARENYQERSAIRKATQLMMPKTTHNTKWIVKLAFLLGNAYEPNPNNSAERDALLIEDSFIDEEVRTYGDIIIGNFVDSHENITYKSVMGLKWALSYCQNASFVIKMYDNTFFNIPKFVRMRNIDLIKAEDGERIPDLYCIPQVGRKPLRKPSDGNFETIKFLVSLMEWPNSTFPDYCQGILSGMTIELIEKVYKVSSHVPYLKLEDIFVTGVAMSKVRDIYGTVEQRNLEVGKETEQEVKSICDSKVIRQTIPHEVGMVLPIDRGVSLEKAMLCLANET